MVMPIMKWVAGTLMRPVVIWWLSAPRKTRFRGLSLIVMPGVFHPGLYFSSRFLAKYLSTQDLNGKRILEPGCGSGAISLYCAQQGAIVTATDISPQAISNAKENAMRNEHAFKSLPQFIVTNVFDGIPPEPYDMVVVNPPYFFSTADSESAKAWYCGSEGEYFHTFFSTLGRYLHAQTKVFMVLADNCDLERIQQIALTYGYQMVPVHKRRIWWEENYILGIRKGISE